MSEDNMDEEAVAPSKAKKLKPIDNNNTFWSLNEVLDFSDSEDLGVDLLSPQQGAELDENSEAHDDSGLVEPSHLRDSPCSSIKIKPQFLRKRIINTGAHGGRDMFSSLSDEIILVILNYLPHTVLSVVAQVSKRFNMLAKDDSLWPRLDMAGKTVKKDTLGYIIMRGTKYLRLAGANILSPVLVETEPILEHFYCKLEYLDLSEAIIFPEDLATLLNKCRSLKKLSLEGCELNDQVCQSISCNGKLDTLNLCKTTGLTANGIETICNNCLRLESVNLGWSGLPHEAVKAFCNKVSPTLTHLNLSGSQTSLKDDEALTVISRCRNLIELDLSDCLEITSKTVSAVTSTLNNLQSISVSRCYRLPLQSCLSLVGMPQLQRINAFRHLLPPYIKILEKKVPRMKFNSDPLSTIARPTVGVRRTSIWGIRCRE